MVLVTDVFKAISDSEALELFRIIALTKPDTPTIMSKIELSRKQYYSRMSTLNKAGLIKRKNGKYNLSAFGRIIYNISLATTENAVHNYWKFKAIDSVEMSYDLPTEQQKNLVDSLIDNQEFRDILYSDDMAAANQKYIDAAAEQ
jgi:hypothetical protein